MDQKVTIATVARRANVSRQTVSNVLNTPEIVRDETRRKVHAAIDELGYRANLAARQMRTGRSRLLAVRIDRVRGDVEGVVLDRFLHGLAEAAGASGYRLVLFTSEGDDGEIATYEELLASYALDAFVLTHTHHGDSRTAWLRRRDVPFITFGRPWGATDRHSWVDVDGAAGTELATRHLVDAGHRRIGFLGWPEGSGVGDDRLDGWARTMAAAGLAVTDLTRRTTNGFGAGKRAARDLLARRRPPTAVVCASDLLALGAREAGVAAVIGFDDTAMAHATGLSSIRQPIDEVAGACIRILVEDLDRRRAGGATSAGSAGGDRYQHVLLTPDLVIREAG
jgi:DNA-binding LacI/PurR family transcriptional regulator